MQKPESYLEKTLHFALDTYQSGNYPIWALLVVNNEHEIGWQNKVVTTWNHRFHAEMDIIQKADNFGGTSDKKIMFVTLEPCNNCAKALIEYGVAEVYYILEDPSWWWKDILERAWVQVHQIKYRYDEYLDLIIEFMTKHGNYNEVLKQYISIKESGKNTYQERLEKTVFDTFINIPTDTIDYEVRKIVYNNTLSYLKNALLRTPEDKHHLIFAWYTGDTEKLIRYCQQYRENPDLRLSEEFIRWLHKSLYPEWYIQRSKDPQGREFIWMIPGEYRTIDIVSNDNTNKEVYLKTKDVKTWIQRIVSEYNDNQNDISWSTLSFLADFCIVHPFGDGNGRVVYILTDILLLKNNLKPLYLGMKKENDKVGFYRILDAVYETRSLEPLYGFIEKYPE